ncbi:MAG: class D sortase [bacterium]
MAHRFTRRSLRKQTPDAQKNKYLRLILAGVGVASLLAFGIFFPWKPFADNLFNKNGLNITMSKEEEGSFQDFGIEIPKLDVKAPVMANVNGDNKSEYNKSLTKGLAHYKGTSLPGEKSNIFVFGHSSSDTDGGRYAKIFRKLDDLKSGDKITVYYKSKKHEYTVTDKKVVEADDLSPLNLTDGEQLTLMTCWPIGTVEKRLIVIAK